MRYAVTAAYGKPKKDVQDEPWASITAIQEAGDKILLAYTSNQDIKPREVFEDPATITLPVMEGGESEFCIAVGVKDSIPLKLYANPFNTESLIKKSSLKKGIHAITRDKKRYDLPRDLNRLLEAGDDIWGVFLMDGRPMAKHAPPLLISRVNKHFIESGEFKSHFKDKAIMEFRADPEKTVKTG